MNGAMFLGIMIPFAGTTLGAACVFLLKKSIKPEVQKSLLGFAAGVMVAAGVWSLLIPAMEMSERLGRLAFVPAAIGFLAGIAFLLAIDKLVPHLHMDKNKPEGPRSRLNKSAMMMLAVTIHNIPEGASVGIVLAAAANSDTPITLAAALALSIGIAIQNFPEGAIISLPLKEETGKGKAFLYGMLSGIVEPAAAVLTILLSSYIEGIMPYMLAFAAGAMIYVVVEELVPEAAQGEQSDVGTIGFAIGFVLMMVMDVTLG
ncbi:MAG: ZIP family metal transporter [Lachnospiraceae bacterium]|nr:ZIP family metal transporter [Lachnospiraceae bacterium]